MTSPYFSSLSWEMRRRILDELEKELTMPKELSAPMEDLEDNNVPLHSRTYCSHLVAPLNHCRRRTFFLPGKCVEEKEKLYRCLHEDRMFRTKVTFLIKERHKLEEELEASQPKEEALQ